MKKILFALGFVVAIGSAHAGWLDALGLTKSSTNGTASAGLAALSQTQMAGGLKDALGNGLQHAVASLGHDGGFLTNVAVKIPVPEKLQSAEKKRKGNSNIGKSILRRGIFLGSPCKAIF